MCGAEASALTPLLVIRPEVGLRLGHSCARELLVQADTCPTAARDGVMGRKAGHAALLGGVARFCGPHMMPEPTHTTGAVCHAAEHFDEARDAPFGAAPPQPPATQPCRPWARPRPVRPSHGLLQPPCKRGRPRGRPGRVAAWARAHPCATFSSKKVDETGSARQTVRSSGASNEGAVYGTRR